MRQVVIGDETFSRSAGAAQPAPSPAGSTALPPLREHCGRDGQRRAAGTAPRHCASSGLSPKAFLIPGIHLHNSKGIPPQLLLSPGAGRSVKQLRRGGGGGISKGAAQPAHPLLEPAISQLTPSPIPSLWCLPYLGVFQCPSFSLKAEQAILYRNVCNQ